MDNLDRSSIESAVTEAYGGKPVARAAPVESQPSGGGSMDEFSADSINNAVNEAYAPSTGKAGIKSQLKDTSPDLTPLREGAANLVTGMGASILGGYHGIYKVMEGLKSGKPLADAIADAAPAVAETQDALTYQPKTEGGQGVSKVLQFPGRVIGEGARVIGNTVNDVTERPALAAAVETGINALPAAFMKRGGRPPVTVENASGEALPTTPRTTPELPAYMRREQVPPPVVAQPVGEAVPVQPIAPGMQIPAAGAPAKSQPLPTLAEAIKSQNATKATGATNESATTAAARHDEAASLPVPIELTEGQATGNIHQLSWEKNHRGEGTPLGDRFNQQATALKQNLDAIRTKLAPDINVSGEAIGQGIVDSYKTADAIARQQVSAKYKALADANGGELPLSGADFVSAADSALKAKNATRFLPAEIRGILDDVRDSGAMSFNDFENYRTILATASRSAKDGNIAKAIGAVRKTLENLPMPEGMEHLKPLADEARLAAKQRFDRIKADPAYKAAVADADSVPMGEPSPLADRFVTKYVVNGTGAGVQNMMKNVGSDTTVAQLIRAGVMDDLRDAAGVDLRTGELRSGNLSQTGLNKAITALGAKRGLVFDPTVAGTIDTLGRVARYTQEQPAGSYVNNSNTLVGQIADKAKTVAEGAINMKTAGSGGTIIRRAIDSHKNRKAVEKALAPRAGTKLGDL